MIYETHLQAAEEGGWSLADIGWHAIDRSIAQRERDIHAALHDAALIEGYLPVYAARLMELVWEDVDATAVLSLELFEGLRHYTALKRYLDAVGHQSALDADAALAKARAGTLSRRYAAAEVTEHLTHFMGSELFAAYFFLRLARRSREPVLCDLLARMARDEFRHSAAAGAILEQRIKGNPELVQRVLRAAENFRHYGSDIVQVPVAEPNDFEAIVALNRKVRAVCGMTPTDHLKDAMGQLTPDP